jgi:DNA-binding NarL/FixJ family response regulator
VTVRVLLADDHDVVRDGLRAFLEKYSDVVVVGSTATGREAVLLAKKLRADMAIMDISMPDLNGIEATRKIRELCPETQVIVLSMHSSLEHVYQALKAGARGFLTKESAGVELVEAVREVTGGRRYLSRQVDEKVVDNYLQLRQSLPKKSPLDRLSPREREVLQLVVEGKHSAQIANFLHLSPKSVDTYRSRLMHKLGVANLAELVKFSIRHGLTSLE